MTCDPDRQRIINDAARILNNIEQGFCDASYWNRLHPTQEPVNFDPVGQMRRIKQSVEMMLKREAALGNVPTVIPIKARERRYIPIVVSKRQAGQLLLEGENRN